MKKLFSNDLLRKIRNDIPINFVISKLLHIYSKSVDGYFRFLCPLCNEFHTATQSSTNLARCFKCQRNFNTIDLVIIVKNYSFKNSVNFLEKYLHNTKSCPDFIKTHNQKSDNNFTSIRNILNNFSQNK
jgi:hypothetical protein